MVGDGLALGGNGRAVQLDAQGLEVVRVLELAHLARRGQQRLGGHAAAVHAGAANVVPLDHRHLEPLQPAARAQQTEREGAGGVKRGRASRTPAPPPLVAGAAGGTHTLHRVDGGAVAAHAAADDDQVIVIAVLGSGGGRAVLAGERHRHASPARARDWRRSPPDQPPNSPPVSAAAAAARQPRCPRGTPVSASLRTCGPAPALAHCGWWRDGRRGRRSGGAGRAAEPGRQGRRRRPCRQQQGPRGGG